MWPFSRALTKDRLEAHRRIRINGMRLTIRRLNPLLDFPVDKMPQIFADFVSRRGQREPGAADLKRSLEDMVAIIEAAVVDPPLARDGKEGIHARDLFRDPTLGPKVYIEILAHSLNVFRGIKGVFFYHRIKWSLWIQWRSGMAQPRPISSSPTAASV